MRADLLFIGYDASDISDLNDIEAELEARKHAT